MAFVIAFLMRLSGAAMVVGGAAAAFGAPAALAVSGGWLIAEGVYLEREAAA